MIINNQSFRKLHETDKFVLGHVFEDGYLVDKISAKEIHLGDFYGDPTCGIISRENNWCLIGGAILSVWKAGDAIFKINDNNLYWACKVKQTDSFEVEILVDAWTDISAIWKINIETLERFKVKNIKIDSDFTDYLDW